MCWIKLLKHNLYAALLYTSHSALYDLRIIVGPMQTFLKLFYEEVRSRCPVFNAQANCTRTLPLFKTINRRQLKQLN